MVKEIHGLAEFERELKYPGLVVVDFFTTWCGPCKMIAPFIESLSHKYPEVKFLKVDIEQNEDIAAPRRISSIPTFHFIVNGRVVDELKGANQGAIEQKVLQYKVNMDPFGGSQGHKLAPSSGAVDPREARLRALGLSTSSAQPTKSEGKPAANPVPAPTVDQATVFKKAQEAADLAAAEKAVAELEAKANELTIIHDNVSPDGEELVPLPVDEEILSQLLDMGFTDERSRKSIYHGKTLEGALGWLDEHQDDADIDQPYLVKKSDTLPKPKMTEAEKQQKIEEVKLKIQQRREEQAKKEKEDEIRREKERRERGQKMEEVREEREKMMRKIELEKQKKEKLVRYLFAFQETSYSKLLYRLHKKNAIEFALRLHVKKR